MALPARLRRSLLTPEDRLANAGGLDMNAPALQRTGQAYDQRRRDQYYDDAMAGADTTTAELLRGEQIRTDAAATTSPGWAAFSGRMGAQADDAIQSGKNFGVTMPQTQSPIASLRRVVSRPRAVSAPDDEYDPGVMRDMQAFGRWDDQDAESHARRLMADAQQQHEAGIVGNAAAADDASMRFDKPASMRAMDILKNVVAPTKRDIGSADLAQENSDYWTLGSQSVREDKQRSLLDQYQKRYGDPAEAKAEADQQIAKLRADALTEVAGLRAGGDVNAAGINALSRIINGMRSTSANPSDIAGATNQLNDKLTPIPPQVLAQGPGTHTFSNGQTWEVDADGKTAKRIK